LVGARGSNSAHVHKELIQKLNQHGDLTLRDATLREALFTISEIWQVNLVVSAEVEGNVNGAFLDTSLREILDAILLANGYSYRPVGQSLVVMRLNELGDTHPLFEAATVHIGAGDPTEVVEAVRLLTSPGGKAQSIGSTGNLLVADFPDRVALIRKFVSELGNDGSTPVGINASGTAGQLEVAQFDLQFVSVELAKESFQSILSEKGKLATMPSSNRLVLVDEPSRITLARQMARLIDVPRAQVRIEAMIYDISLEDIEALGFNWSHGVKARHNGASDPQSVLGLNSVTQTMPIPGTVGGAMTIMNLSRHLDINTIVQALHEANDARLLADPNVVVVDHEKAKIQIVTEIPYQERTQTSQGGDIGTTAFREVGVMLEVTPHMSDDGTIEMQVMPTFSRLTGFTPGDNPQPIIDSRIAETRVRIVDGQTFVIGGLRQRSDVGDFSGLPYLKNLKYIGFLFRSKKTTVRESELVVFLTPRVIMPFEGTCGRNAAAEDLSRQLLNGIPPASPMRPEMGPVLCPDEDYYEGPGPVETLPQGEYDETPTEETQPRIEILPNEVPSGDDASRDPRNARPRTGPYSRGHGTSAMVAASDLRAPSAQVANKPSLWSRMFRFKSSDSKAEEEEAAIAEQEDPLRVPYGQRYRDVPRDVRQSRSVRRLPRIEPPPLSR
jgi:general secretion pathway protein D